MRDPHLREDRWGARDRGGAVRAAPLNCPYCGEPSIEPVGDERAFYCSSCDRRFELRFLGLGEGGA
ncbi:MAG: hypothetical protein JJE05_08395 [Actinobacteria bacterium]|nr:hypothetical protein [Actinomycetota bacterium]